VGEPGGHPLPVDDLNVDLQLLRELAGAVQHVQQPGGAPEERPVYADAWCSTLPRCAGRAILLAEQGLSVSVLPLALTACNDGCHLNCSRCICSLYLVRVEYLNTSRHATATQFILALSTSGKHETKTPGRKLRASAGRPGRTNMQAG
jgi:hypothetical protein